MKKRILVIEDTPKHREDAKRVLSSLEEEVEADFAHDFKEGLMKLELARDRKDFLKKMVGDVYVDVEFYEEELRCGGGYDGVITDLYMPVSASYDLTKPVPEPGTREHEIYMIKKQEAELIPAGAILAGVLDKARVPFVICTAGSHHGAKYDYVCGLAREVGWGELVDGDAGRFDEAESKEWRRAYETLKVKMGRAEAKTSPEKITPEAIKTVPEKLPEKVVIGETKTDSEYTRKILIGDDQLGSGGKWDVIRRTMFEKDYAKAFSGCSLEYVSDPEKFLELARTGEYHALFIDLRWGAELPTEGYRLLKECKEYAPLRILWTSEDKEAIEKGYEYGATNCISKSPYPEELEKILCPSS